MTNADQPYSGVENLEVMAEAENYNRFLLNLVRDHAREQDRILDFGAGGGQFAVPMLRMGYDVTALEPDSRLRRMMETRGVRTVGDLKEIARNSLDYVYSLNVLEHIEDDVGALRGIFERLRSGGTLLVYVPAFPVLYTAMDRAVGHVRRYTRKTLVNALDAAGFQVSRVRYADSLGFGATLIFKAVGNKSGQVNRSALKLYDRLAFPLSRLLDLSTQRWIGKNLFAIARKP